MCSVYLYTRNHHYIILSKYQKSNHFTDLYDRGGIKYPTVISNNNYAIFEKEILEIALVVLYVSAGIKVFIEKGEVKLRAYKSIKQSNVSKHYHTR